MACRPTVTTRWSWSGMSSDFQNQGDLTRRIVAALAELPVRGVVTTGKGIDPAEVPAPPNVQVVRSAPHAEVLRRGGRSS